MAALTMMTYWTLQWPASLALLGLLPGLIYLSIRSDKQRREALQLLGQSNRANRISPHSLRIYALICLIIALARPGYNPQPLAQQARGRDVVIALDVSRSMLAADLQPSRLAVAKQSVRDLLDAVSNQRVGLIAYGGSASILCPLTRDRNFVRYMLEQAGPHSVDFGGSQLQAAIEKALDQVFDATNLANSDLIILSDGGNHADTEQALAEMIQSNELRTHIIGLGDPLEASAIALKDTNDQTVYIKYKGEIVRSKLEDSALTSLAAKSEWIQYHAMATTAFDLGKLYTQQVQPAHNSAQTVSTHRYRYQEVAPYLIGFAGIVLMLSHQRLSPKRAHVLPLWLLLALLCAAAATGHATVGSSQNQAAMASMQQGQFEAAANQFEALYLELMAQAAPASHLAALQYNRGLAWSKQALQIESPQDQLLIYNRAQAAFLLAKRWQPSLLQASGQLDQSAANMKRIQKAIAAQSQAQQQQADQMHALLKLIEALLATQLSIREQFDASPFNFEKSVLQQQAAIQDAGHIKAVLNRLQATSQTSNRMLPTSPLAVLKKAQNELNRCQAQQEALVKLIPDYPRKPAICLELTSAIELSIRRMIELFSTPSIESDDFDDEWSEMDAPYSLSDSDETGQNLSSSAAGDFAQSSVMQALPIPNYSADTILMEEEGSQQFRQQQRQAAKATKVERDY